MTSYLHPPEQKHIIVTVISDLVTDYRVHKVCQTLHSEGFKVLLIGLNKKKSISLKERDYQTDRLSTWFHRSILFYIEFNIRLFFRLFRKKADLYLGNDLDVMPATTLIASLKNKPLVYDSHEYFLGMAGMEEKPVRKGIWKMLEKRVFARLKYIYTVSEPICELYTKTYHKSISVVRNLPLLHPQEVELSAEESAWIQSMEQKIPASKSILILQGAGINQERGVEELVQSMAYLPDHFHLIIIGGGDIFERLRRLIDTYQLKDRVTLIPKVPFAVLFTFTRRAQLGLSIDKPSVLNHRFSLPNKLFEYLHAGVPVLASRLPEQEKIIKDYEVGAFIENHNPEHIAQKIKEIFADPVSLNRWKENTSRARNELNWEKESKIILDIFKQVEKDSVNY